jgi:hypothetical protein
MPPGKPPLGPLGRGHARRWKSQALGFGYPRSRPPSGAAVPHPPGDGFSDASCTLARRIDTDYIDLNLLDDVAFIGDDGATAYEGRVATIPRSFGDMHSVTVNCAGWMAHARDRKFTEIYVDRDFGSWGDMPLNRKVAVAGRRTSDALLVDRARRTRLRRPNQAITSAQTGGDVVHRPDRHDDRQGHVRRHRHIAAGRLDRPDALRAADDDGSGTSPTSPPDLRLDAAHGDSDPRRCATPSGPTSRTGPPPSRPPSAQTAARGDRVYGNHGLTTRTIDSTTPDGLYASDVITNIASRFCPKLSTTGVQATTFPIPHLVFKDPTDPYDAFLDVNKYHLWDLGVWENKTLTFRPNDLSDYDWEIRLSDLGTTIDLQGDSADDLANGIVVNYTDVATGHRHG